VLISLYFVVRGGIAYVGGSPSDPMIFAQWNEDNTAWFPRMRAFGFLNDPNDLAQFLITVAPFLWLQWRAKRFLMNACRVLLPAAVVLLGVFLTHSRGAIIAMVAVLLFAFKDSIGRTRSIILAVLAFVAMQVFNFSGGRTLSIGAGTDRIDAWSAGLEMFRSSPIFGVGYKQFFENYGAQAHNSFIHCAAELGFFGYFFWMALIVFSMSDLGTLANHHLTQVDDLSDSPPEPQPRQIARPSEGRTTESESSASTVTVETVTHDESVGGSESETETLRRLAILLRISFVGYLAAAFFLSRAYTITLFVLLGMAATLKLIAISSGNFVRRQPSRRLYSLTAQISVASLALIYIIVRIHWLR
jgi:hypothetical protein